MVIFKLSKNNCSKIPARPGAKARATGSFDRAIHELFTG